MTFRTHFSAAPDAGARRDAPRRVLIIYNPAAGWRRRGRFRKVLAALGRCGCVVTVRETRGPGDATRLAGAAARAEVDVIAVAGGDGTFNEALNGLAPGAPSLAFVPLGTANVLAWEIGLGTAPARIARTIAAGRPLVFRPGEVNGRRFAMMAGVGFDGRVAAGADAGLKRALGRGAFVWRMAVELARGRLPALTVRADGEVHAAASAIVAKARHYAGRFVCAPDARLERDSFEVCLLIRGGRWNTVRCALALAAGRLHGARGVDIVRAREIGIEGPAGEPVQADGEVVAALPARIRLADLSLALLVPED